MTLQGQDLVMSSVKPFVVIGGYATSFPCLYKKSGAKFNRAKMTYSRNVLMKLENIAQQDEQILLDEILG